MGNILHRFFGGVMCLLLGGCCGPDLITHDEIRGQDIHPYVGLVRNFADVAISIPSANSDATIIVPAHSSAELTVWEPNTKILGYLNGKEVYCQNITARPKQYTYFCKKYDFVAEIHLEPPPGDLPSFIPSRPRSKPRSDNPMTGHPAAKQLSWQQD